MNARGHLPSETLDLLLLSALPAPQAEAARSHLQACPACARELETLQAFAQKFEREVYGRTLPRVRERLESPKSAWSPFRLFMLAPTVALAALVAVVVLPRLKVGSQPDVLTKGAPGLQVYALRSGASESERLRPNAQVKAGDRLRFVVEPAGFGYLLLVSVDGQGQVSTYFPPEGQRSAPVEPGQVALPGSIELDASPGPERLYAYFSRQPLDLTALADRLRAAPDTPPDLPETRRLAFPLQKGQDKEKEKEKEKP